MTQTVHNSDPTLHRPFILQMARGVAKKKKKNGGKLSTLDYQSAEL